MCNLDYNERQDVNTMLAKMTSSRKTFTGYDVKSEVGVHLDTHVSGGDASEYVREVFNNHDQTFYGYACMPIPKGPLVYFHVDTDRDEVEQSIHAIKAALEDKALPTDDEKDEKVAFFIVPEYRELAKVLVDGDLSQFLNDTVFLGLMERVALLKIRLELDHEEATAAEKATQVYRGLHNIQ